MTKHIVAVYGTLREGYGNHRLMEAESTEFLGTYRTDSNKWRMVSLGGFPAVTHGEGNISVEVYSVDDDTLRSLDSLEGYPTMYQKTKLVTPYGRATMYVMQTDAVRRTPLVESGDWNEFTGRGTIDIVREVI